MRLTESNYFTGDRYADSILTKLTDYLEDLGYVITDYETFYDSADLEKFVGFVFDEFPMTVDTPNADYDVKWSWEEFLDSKEGKSAKQWIEDNPKEIDSAYFYDDLDKATIAETMDFIEKPIEEFCKSNSIGKQLSKKDKQCLIDTISNAEIGEFENGYTWGADEYTKIIMTDHDGEHDYYAIAKEMNNRSKYAKDGMLIDTWYAYYNDVEVLVLYGIDLEELAKKAIGE